ncbi:MAG: DMT family transporter [Atopobiaceae bacterium]|nr:DMT family transporter [Atopobiaceae bacterium]
MTKRESIIVLLSITLCWSSSYLFIQEVPQGLSDYAYLALTSGVAGIILAIIFFRLMSSLTKQTIKHAAILSVLITGNMLFEKMALGELPAPTVSSLAAMNIVIVPIILMLRKEYPTRNNVVGIIVIIIGIVVSSRSVLKEGAGFLGVLYVVCSCVCMSLYTIVASDFTDESNPLLLTIMQLLFTAAIGFVLWVVTTPDPFGSLEFTPASMSYIFILAFFSKAYAYVMLMYAEKYADPVSITVIAATDPVVTLLLAVFVPGAAGGRELLTPPALVGAAIITLGAIIAGTDFLSSKEAADEKQSAEAELAAAESTTSVPAAYKFESPEIKAFGNRYQVLWFAFVIMLLFALLGISIDVMHSEAGFRNLRPENCLSVTAGLMLGPIGALACSLGNFLADCFHGMYDTMTLGLVGNFIMAFIPYKAWMMLSRKRPDVHSGKHLLRYVWVSLLGAMSCACFLGIALQYFYDRWYDGLIWQMFMNNFVFSLAFGLPLFIVLTSEGVWVMLKPEFLVGKIFTYGIPIRVRLGGISVTRAFLAALTVLLTVLMYLLYNGYNLDTSRIVQVLSLACGICELNICLLPIAGHERGDRSYASR